MGRACARALGDRSGGRAGPSGRDAAGPDARPATGRPAPAKERGSAPRRAAAPPASHRDPPTALWVSSHAVATAAAGASGGTGLAVVLGALLLLAPILIRWVRVVADGPPPEPPSLVLERPG